MNNIKEVWDLDFISLEEACQYSKHKDGQKMFLTLNTATDYKTYWIVHEGELSRTDAIIYLKNNNYIKD